MKARLFMQSFTLQPGCRLCRNSAFICGDRPSGSGLAHVIKAPSESAQVSSYRRETLSHPPSFCPPQTSRSDWFGLSCTSSLFPSSSLLCSLSLWGSEDRYEHAAMRLCCFCPFIVPPIETGSSTKQHKHNRSFGRFGRSGRFSAESRKTRFTSSFNCCSAFKSKADQSAIKAESVEQVVVSAGWV